MRAALTGDDGTVVATVELDADTAAVQAAHLAGSQDPVAGLVPEVLLHGGRVFVRVAGIDYQERSVTVTSGPPVLARSTAAMHDGEPYPALRQALARATGATGPEGRPHDRDVILVGGHWGTDQLRMLLLERDEMVARLEALEVGLDEMSAVAGHQTDGHLHPLTCSNDSSHQPLVPCWERETGLLVLRCAECDYRQDWVPGQAKRWRPTDAGLLAYSWLKDERGRFRLRRTRAGVVVSIVATVFTQPVQRGLRVTWFYETHHQDPAAARYQGGFVRATDAMEACVDALLLTGAERPATLDPETFSRST